MCTWVVTIIIHNYQQGRLQAGVKIVLNFNLASRQQITQCTLTTLVELF